MIKLMIKAWYFIWFIIATGMLLYALTHLGDVKHIAGFFFWSWIANICFKKLFRRNQTEKLETLLAEGNTLEELARKGNPEAQYRLAFSLVGFNADLDEYHVGPDCVKALGLMKKSAENGCIEAQYAYGKMLANRIGYSGIPKLSEAFKWMNKAAKAGHAKAKLEIDSLSIN